MSLPQRIIAVLHRHLWDIDGVAIYKVAVELAQFAKQRDQRSAFKGHVRRDMQENVFLIGQAYEDAAQHEIACQVKWDRRLLLDDAFGLGLSVARGKLSDVERLQIESPLLRQHWNRGSPRAENDRAQDLVALDDRLHRAVQGRGIERSMNAGGVGNVISSIVRSELAEIPKPLLPDGEDARFPWSARRNHRPLRSLSSGCAHA